MYKTVLLVVSCALGACLSTLVRAESNVIRAGIVGCDTSHVIAFTDLINDPQAEGALAKVEIVAAYPGGSPDLPESRDRVEGFTERLRAEGVKIVDSLDELEGMCDAFLLESVDGRVHLEQFREIATGKPVFIDKPAAASLADVIRIFEHAEATETPIFTSSALRFCDAVRVLKQSEKLGDLLGCETASPMKIEAHHPDLFWYGVHGVESLYAILGPGCESVARTDTDASSVVVGSWSDGRIGSFRGLKKGKSNYSFTAYGTGAIEHRSGFSGYGPTAAAICEFFVTRQAPVSAEESIELFAFMEGADESKRQGGAPVAIAEVIDKARTGGESER